MSARIAQNDRQLKLGGVYGHNFVLRRKAGDPVSLAVRDLEPAAGRAVEVWITEPGVQSYTGNFRGVKGPEKGGVSYAKRSGFCLETQHFPDSLNLPKFWRGYICN